MKWSAVAVPIMLLIYALVIVNITNYRQEEFDALKQLDYDDIVNYACDAAMQEAMEQAMDTSVDYRDVYAINLDPEYALYTYTECILRSLGWSNTEENRDIILQEYTPYFLVVESDGFYVYGSVQDSTVITTNVGDDVPCNVKPNMWSPKIPFSEYDDDYIYIYTLEDDYYIKYDKAKGEPINNVPYVEGTGVGTLASRDRVVANKLNSVLSQCISSHSNGTVRIRSAFPSEDTVYVRAVKRPSIYAMFIDHNVLTGEPIVAVGGTQVNVSMKYICYTRGNNKFYTYAYNRDEIENALGCAVEKVVSSQNEAALEGYYPDVLFR